MILMNLNARKWKEKVRLPEKQVWIRLEFDKLNSAKISSIHFCSKLELYSSKDSNCWLVKNLVLEQLSQVSKFLLMIG